MITKTFLDVEKEANEKGLFVDYEVVSATANFSVIKCTVSDKSGKRVVRIVSGADILQAQQKAGVYALYGYFEKPLPDTKTEASRNSAPQQPTTQQTPATQQPRTQQAQQRTSQTQNTQQRTAATQTTQQARAAQSQRNTQAAATNQNQQKAPSVPAIGGSADKPAPVNAQTQQSQARTTTQTNSSPAQQQKTAGAQEGMPDFKLTLGAYDDMISNILKTDAGRAFIHKVLSVKAPGAAVKDKVDMVRKYVTSHGINV